MFNDRSTPLSLLATRRSGKPRDLAGPGPSPDQIDRMIALAARTPDHGKIAPWRFVVVEPDRRGAFADLLEQAWLADHPGAPAHERESARQFAMQAPALVVVLSAPVHGHKVPLWEQELSAGAAAMNLLHAAHAMGYAGGWLTGWPAFSDRVRDAFGGADQRLVGFMFIGTPSRPLDERPRPDLAAIASRWAG
ncbi:nitroreductase family protein [Sphingomonas bacterium]|uniref:nitroreductase family protein n=1 Tax=Sphingomonas bacterium TaxID=1895847 RepID=UPI001576C20D|nr:nitroreductase [Sphingomonas bacterium]